MAITKFRPARDDEAETPGTWRVATTGQLDPIVVVVCPQCGSYGFLGDHRVLETGVVQPSMVCTTEGCTYHEFIQLQGWTRGEMDMNLATRREQQREWDLWKELCLMLKDTGAVTDEDCKSKASARDTVGQRLFAGIRAWSEAVVEARGVAIPMPDPIVMGMTAQILQGLAANPAYVTAGGQILQSDLPAIAKKLADDLAKQFQMQPALQEGEASGSAKSKEPGKGQQES